MRAVDIEDQARATNLIFASDAAWTVVRGSDLEEGASQGLPVWARHVGVAVLASNLTRRTDFALFMVAAVEDDALIHEAPAIVGRESPSARAHAMRPAEAMALSGMIGIGTGGPLRKRGRATCGGASLRGRLAPLSDPS